MQRIESLDVGLQRLVSDLEAAEFVSPNVTSKTATFVGDAKSVTLFASRMLREQPLISNSCDWPKPWMNAASRWCAPMRRSSRLIPICLSTPNSISPTQSCSSAPPIGFPSPSREPTGFGANSWRNGIPAYPLPARIQVRHAATDELLAVSTAALLHADLPAECVAQHSSHECIEGMRAELGRQSDRQGQPAGSPP